MHLLYNLKNKTTIIENITADNYICYYFRCSPLQVCQSDMNSNNNKQHEWMIRKVLNTIFYIDWWHMRPCDITWEDLRPYLVVLSSTFAANCETGCDESKLHTEWWHCSLEAELIQISSIEIGLYLFTLLGLKVSL